MQNVVKVDVLKTGDSRRAKSLPLKYSHRAFCVEYVRNGGNGRRAWIAIGGAETSAGSIASKLLKRPDIQAEIALIKAQQMGSYIPLTGSGGNGGNLPPTMTMLPAGPSGAKPTAAMSDADRLTRTFIVETLMRNTAICMGDAPTDKTIFLKKRRRVVMLDNGDKIPVAEARKRGLGDLPEGIDEYVEELIVRSYTHDAAGANRALELLDKQLDKLREDAGLSATDGEEGPEYVDSRIQAKLDEMARFLDEDHASAKAKVEQGHA